MSNPRRFAFLALLTLSALCAQPHSNGVTGRSRVIENSKSAAGFSVDNMDQHANPCVDFYQYACGMWMANNPIPPDQSRWDRFDELAERNRTILRNILEKASVNNPKRDDDTQKIGDFYFSCMNEPEINRRGIDPIRPELSEITGIRTKAALAAEIPKLQRKGVNIFFNFDSGPDAKNSMLNIGQADQGGLGLPEREYYFKKDAKSVELRKKYVAHVTRVLELSGQAPARAAVEAQAVLKIETELAKGSLDVVSRRDPLKTYHKMSVHELASLSPSIDWAKYFEAMGAPAMDGLNVVAPEFFKQMESTISHSKLEDLKTYMRWHLLHSGAPLLSVPFEEENFNFYEKVLTGVAEQRPRWKRCVEYVDADLGFALGKKYVDETFGAEGKQRTLKMVQQIEKALAEDIKTLDWMTPETKKQAFEKLDAVTNKIGYPDKWRNYSSVKIARNDAVGNDFRATGFEVDRRLKKIGQPVDRGEWLMTPPTVNAYYNPTENNINFPAGILQPPFYDNNLDAAVNFGAGGSVIGHELTHGFDDQGRQYDAQGNVASWWTPEDAKEFEKRAQCFIDEYSAFEPVDGVHLNGKLTLGENTADNGGVRLAFMALMESLEGKPQPKIDGFTPEQRFFLGWSQIWCQNMRPELSRLLTQTDPHSPGRNRVNGVFSNMPEFQQAFACKQGQPMVRQPACRVW
jgi:endothelin-converting enzyme/putative endopeptidase